MSAATPQALIQDAQTLIERAGKNIFEQTDEQKHDAVFAVFLVRQKILVIIESFTVRTESINDLYDACIERDI